MSADINSTASDCGTLIKTWRDFMGLSQDGLAEAVGLSSQIIGRYERGKTSPTLVNLERIVHDGFHISMLEFFSGPARPKRPNTEDIEIFREVDTDAPRGYRPVALPLYSGIPASGWDSPPELEGEYEVLRHVARDGLVVVRVTGLSMYPRFLPDDLVLVDTKRTRPKSGEPIVALYRGETTFKRYRVANRQPLLVPDNPEFPPIEIADDNDLVVLGVVTDIVHRGGPL